MKELTDRVCELEKLTGQIESFEPFQIALSQIAEKIRILDDNWQNVDKDNVYRMQVTKMGLMEVIGIVDEWREELKELKAQLVAEQNPDKIQLGDFDNET